MLTTTEIEIKTNFTKTFFRFLKNEGAYGQFIDGLNTTDNGRSLKLSFGELKTNKGKLKVSEFFPYKNPNVYKDDPIKWLMYNNPTRERYRFLEDLINAHIRWEKTKQGTNYWHNLHMNWQIYLMSIYKGITPDKIALPNKQSSFKEGNSFCKQIMLDVPFKVFVPCVVLFVNSIIVILSQILKYIFF